FLAAGLIRSLHLNKSLPACLYALAPATPLGMGLMYLSCLFNYNCRGKFTVDVTSMQHLPFATAVPEAGEVSFRFATFFWSAVFMFILSYVCTEFYYIKKKERCSTACFFLLLFSAGQFILDSTRYDAEYFPFNGFVSILQIFDGVCILVLTIAFSVRVIKRKGFKWYYILIWLAQAGAMTATGMMEYMVQRYSDQHLKYYGFMGLSCVAMFAIGFALYLMGCRKRKAVRKVTAEEVKAETAVDKKAAKSRKAVKYEEIAEEDAYEEDAADDVSEEEMDILDLGDTRNLTLVDADGYLNKSVSEVDEKEYLNDDDLDTSIRSRKRSKKSHHSEDEYEEEVDEKSAVVAFIGAILAAVGLGAFFASRKKD
ncbi:MAG: prolipoprotein diacylglyceryl transferase, partial [Lachnospiraceae bacterium]|nr:prolipoprotein diacylglyceryl transferase [Lachnospiraceae bacterium]